MQPNKSVEEIIHKIIQEQVASEVIYQDGFAEKKLLNCLVKLEKELVNFITSHTNTVLQGVVERVEKEKVKVYDNWATSHDRDEERFTKLTKEEKGYNKGLDLSLSLINDQIISNEEKKETWETKVGMLRQWLNEDRITDPQKMVTNEQIIKWLE